LNAAQRAELEALGPDTVQGKLTHPVLGEAQSFQASSPTIFYAETLRIGSRKSIARKGVQKSVGPTSVLSWALPVLSWPLLASASASGWGWRSSLCAAVQRPSRLPSRLPHGYAHVTLRGVQAASFLAALSGLPVLPLRCGQRTAYLLPSECSAARVYIAPNLVTP